MSQDVQTGRGRSLAIVAWVLVPVAVLGVLLVVILRNSSAPITEGTGKHVAHQENFLAAARSTLARQTDLTACKSVIPQLNAHLQQAKDLSPAALTQEVKDRLRTEMGLTREDLAEVESSTFTALDAHHLENCLLLRDAARSLELATPGGRGSKVKQTPLDRARLAFAFVMREVQLRTPNTSLPNDSWAGPAPPAFVLRRGWGSDLGRALVFLALLEQFGIEDEAASGLQGSLLFCPDKSGKKRLWACGVAVGARPEALYLFDPRLGLPLPGPDGKEVATLAQARSNPAVLDQLQVGEVRYDVTAEQVKKAEVYLVCPLSALAPRLAVLQNHLLRDRMWNDHLLPAAVRVRLAEDLPAALNGLQAAVEHSGEKPAKVRLWREGGTILRRFLPREEGGSDVRRPFALRRLEGFTLPDDPGGAMMFRRDVTLMQLVPWKEFPPVFRDPRQFRWDYGLGKALHEVFAAPFQQPLLTPGSPRDLILRGRPIKAAPDLVKEQEHWQQTRQRAIGATNLMPGVVEWVQQALDAYADLARAEKTGNDAAAKARLGELWKWKPDDPMTVLVMGSVAKARAPETTYQLGLCKHEVAARLQARMDLAARGGVALPDDAHKTDDAWKDAEGYWKEYVETYADRPGLVSARRLYGEVLALRGRTNEAIDAWKNVSAPMTPLEKLGNLWLAKQLEERKKGG